MKFIALLILAAAVCPFLTGCSFALSPMMLFLVENETGDDISDEERSDKTEIFTSDSLEFHRADKLSSL